MVAAPEKYNLYRGATAIQSEIIPVFRRQIQKEKRIFPTLDLTRSQRNYLSTLREAFIEQVLPHALRHDEEPSLSLEGFDLARELKYPNYLLKSRASGKPDRKIELLGGHIFGFIDPSFAAEMSMHTRVLEFIDELGTEEQVEKYIGEAEEGATFCSATSEPKQSFATKGSFILDTEVEERDGYLVVNGMKHFVTNFPKAKFIVAAAKVKDSTTVADGYVLVAVPTSAKGVNLIKPFDATGLRGTGSDKVQLDHVELPIDAMIGKPGDAIRAGVLRRFGLAYGAYGGGITQAILYLTEDIVDQTRAFLKEDSLSMYQLGQIREKLLAVLQSTDGAAKAFSADSYVGNTIANFYRGLAADAISQSDALSRGVTGGSSVIKEFPHNWLDYFYRSGQAAAIMPPSLNTTRRNLGENTGGATLNVNIRKSK